MKALEAVRAVRAIGRTGLFRPVRPAQYVQMALLARGWGTSPAAGSAIAALRAPDHTAVADENGCLTWRQLDGAATALTGGLGSEGVAPDTTVGVMCRNHRGFLQGVLAASKLGADVVLLNTEFAAEQLGEVLERESIGAVLFDDEFADAFDEVGYKGARFDGAAIARLTDDNGAATLEPPPRTGRIVILTSGTTGTPKGAQRDSVGAPLELISGAFSRLPFRAREPVVVAPPLFHGLGFGFFGFSLLLQATLVVRGRFDAEAVLADVERHRATTLVAVPVMLQRILDLPGETRGRYDTSSLRMIVCSGSALSAELATAVMDSFGDILFNFYGSTETGWAAMADPADLWTAPGTVGRSPEGTAVALLDDDGRPVDQGESGRIFVGSEMVFEGYTGGGGKDVVDGLTSTGDVGHFDDEGRLFVEGRADDMIVSGGENVFPVEVEDLLRGHEGIADVAVVGVDDEDMGQRLAAFVVSGEADGLTADDVRGFVRSHLARYKVPRDVVFVDDIPRTATGKVVRGELQPQD